MKKAEYLQRALDLYNAGKIDAQTYDAMIMNAEIFCDEDDDDRLPSYKDRRKIND